MKFSRQFSFAVVCFGLGYWVHLLLSPVVDSSSSPLTQRGGSYVGLALSQNLLECLPSSTKVKSRNSREALLTPEKQKEQEVQDLQRDLESAHKVYLKNLHKRARVFGATGAKLKRLRIPNTLTRQQKAMWHPAAYVLEYYKPMYPCLNEERMGIWTERGGWICQPNSLVSSSLVYTFGSQGMLSFEVELYHRTQPEIHLFNPGFPADVQEKLRTREEFHYHAQGLGDKDGKELLTLKTLMEQQGHSYIDLLKVDCGGCEYAALKMVLQSEVVAIGQILVDVQHITDVPRLKWFLAMFEKRGYRMFHLEQDWRVMDALSLSYIHESLCQPNSQALSVASM
eukprot:TRINITY_DN5422_c0_g1_i1.p1 TRINITY_DN5422_c0_g1~~TRINITY_DN5422_c0_g1_i1.p1  ORF type:complete len:340 (+),score=57.78 TRINITY_DN5422_c0_g1_i1:1338-2357(+)